MQVLNLPQRILTQKSLQQYYQKLLTISANEQVFAGKYKEAHTNSLASGNVEHYSEEQFSFVRYTAEELALVVVNFSDQAKTVTITLPADMYDTGFSIPNEWQELLTEQSYQTPAITPTVLVIDIAANDAVILKTTK